MKYNQQLIFLLICLITVNYFYRVNSSQFKHKNNQEPFRIPKGVTILTQGWGHYYHESNTFKSKPTNLFQNNEYYNQRVRKSEKNKKDKNGNLNIPDRSSFYLVVYKDVVSIYSARNKIERKIVDNLFIKNISPIPEDNVKLGGVVDLKQLKDYSCFRVKTYVPVKFHEKTDDLNITNSKDTEYWTFCFEEDSVKRKFFSLIINLKISEQRERDYFVTAGNMNAEDKQEEASSIEDKAKGKGGSLEVVDGKLQLLQDWSECTLKCGGGKSYQQWMCIPPKNGGEPCQGELIRSKDCNIQACPLSTLMAEKVQEDEEYKKPIVKIGPYSKRHNRYHKCIVKEGDSFRLELDEETGDYNRIPSKLLMNNRTLSIFEDDTYEKLVYSFKLEKTSIEADSSEFCTLILTDTQKKIKLRGFDQSCGTPDEDKFVLDWKREFALFKYECKTGRQDILLDKEAQALIDEMAKKRSELVNTQQQAEKAEKLREDFSSGQQGRLADNIAGTQKLGLKAVNKEAQMENMIIAEEKEREQLELAKVQEQIDREKKKAELMNLSIKEKEFDDFFKQQDREAEKEIFDAKQEAREKIQGQRYEMQQKIEKMRKIAQVKKSQLLNKLKKAKTALASKVMKTLKVGNSDICNLGKKQEQQDVRTSYCNKAFPDDYLLNLECKDIENFCYTCCEKEFGNAYLDRREDCYNECDGLKKSNVEDAASEPPKKKVKWVWERKKNSSE